MNWNSTKCRALSVFSCLVLAAVIAAALPFGPALAFANDVPGSGTAKDVSAPGISSLSPSSGAPIGGTSVTIYGSNFTATGTTRVTFGGVDATDVTVAVPGYLSPGYYISCKTPAHAEGAVDVVVINPDAQSATLAGGFTYVTPPAPILTHLSPSSGLAVGGTAVTIFGSGFMKEGLTRVTFGNAEASNVYVIDANSLGCTTPPHALGAVDVTVIRADGLSGTRSNGFTFAPPPPPEMTGITPPSGPVEGGISVDISGYNFVGTGVTQVSFGGVSATNVVYRGAGTRTAAHVLCTIPPHALGAVDVVLTNPDGQSCTLANGFAYAPPLPPAPTSVTPPRGTPVGGTDVYILGTGFSEAYSYRVTFGGVDATNVQRVNDGLSSIRITCTTPAHAEGTVDVAVIRSDGQSGILSGGYTYTATTGPVLTGISPPSDTTLGGARVQLSGWNFNDAGGTRVTFGGVDATSVAVYSEGYGYNPYVNCVAPPHAAGAVDVVIINPDGQSYTLSNGFEYTQAPPPAPSSITPAEGTTLGGTEVNISGLNFSWNGTIRVTFGGVDATNVHIGSGGYMTPPVLVCTTPAHATGTAAVVVINSDGQTGTLPNGFTYTQAPAPTLSSLSPGRGLTEGGVLVSLEGTGFAQIGTTRVTFGGAEATDVTVSGDTIRCAAPAHAVGAVDVTVINPDGLTGSLPGAFSYHVPGERVLRVDADNTSGVEDGTTWETAFASIQSAIAATAASDQTSEIWVAEGTYTAAAPGTVVASMEYLCDLYGGFAGVETQRDERDFAAHVCVIDGQNQSACVYGADATRLDGFTITGGRGPLRLGEQSSWQYTCSWLCNNGTDYSNAVAVDNSGVSTTLVHCKFTGNSPGLAVVANLSEEWRPSNPVIAECDFTGNAGEYCAVLNGALSGIKGTPVIEDCSFTGTRNGIFDYARDGECNAVIARCIFTANNTALLEYPDLPSRCAAQLENCVFSGQTETVLSLFNIGNPDMTPSTAAFTNCTFAANTVPLGVFYMPGGAPVQIALRNSIVWGNIGQMLNTAGPTTTITASHCDIQDGFAGTGNIASDPLFVDTASGDFRLQAGSPCIDAGTAADAPAADLVGMPRPQGAGFDMGAMEMLVSTMPDLSGLARTAAVEWVASAKLYVRDETEEYNPTIPDNHVIRHTPAADTQVVSGSPVDWVVSKGPEPVSVPDVTGRTQAAATAAIAAADLVVGTVTERYNAAVPAGTVLSQSPLAGAVVLPGTAVDMVVSRGVQPVVMPNVAGQPETEAEMALTGAGLVPGAVTRAYSDTVPAGSVAAQSPAAGSELPPGSTVSIVISLGSTPPPEGETESPAAGTARQEMAGAYNSADTNGDGALSFGEASGAVLGLTQTVFDELDTNADGQLSADELGVNDSAGCAGCQSGKCAVTPGKSLGDLFLTALGFLGIAAMAAVRRP